MVKSAALWLRPAPLGALCFYINEEGTQLGQTMAVHRQKHISEWFMAWALLRSLGNLTSRTRHSCDQDHDSRTVWQRARDIAGTALGPRGWFFAPPDACRLTQSDWDHHMGATFDAQKVDTPKALLAPPGPPLAKTRLTDLRRTLLRQHNFKALPQDTLPPEVWKILARFYPGFLKMMDDTTLAVIRKTRTAPTFWSLSPIWPVPKDNGKQGLQGKRPVNGVHCFSRAFMRLSYKRPVPSPYVYGGVAGRRREEKVGVALDILGWCIRAGKSHMFKLRDVRGAFTNVTGNVIHHNQHVNTILRTPGGGDWKITKGTRQGDFGCDIFLGVYDIPLKKYGSGRQPLNEVLKLEGQKIDISLLTFVDDLIGRSDRRYSRCHEITKCNKRQETHTRT